MMGAKVFTDGKKGESLWKKGINYRKEDLVDIPQYFKSILQDYKYILRKYPSTSSCADNRVGEIVLYAIPSERFVFGNIKAFGAKIEVVLL